MTRERGALKALIIGMGIVVLVVVWTIVSIQPTTY
jgi:hypothetical protein